MLTKLHLKNVCGIEEEVVDFAPIMRISGVNNVGKSTLTYDPVETLMLGDGFPESMLRKGTKQGSMELFFDDGRSIKYERSSGKQLVTLYQDGKQLKAPWSTVKDCRAEIQTFTGGIELKLEKGKPAETPQFVPLSAPQVYMVEGMSPETVLAKLSNLGGGVGTAQAKRQLESQKRSLEERKKLYTEELKASSEELGKYAAVDFEKLEAYKATVESCEETWQQAVDTYENCEYGIVQREHITKRLEINREWLTRIKRIASIVDVNDNNLAAMKMKFNTLRGKIEELNRYADDIDRLEKTVEEERRALAEEQAKIPSCETCGRPL